MQADVALLVSSSDNTQDVLNQVFPAIRKFWPDCPFQIYVGKNTSSAVPAGCRGVYARTGVWRGELLEQLEQVSAARVILLLDDFLLTAPVDTARVLRVVDQTIASGYAYVRLKPLQRAAVPGAVARVVSGLRGGLVEKLKPSMPYYSGLQPAIWAVEHLRTLLLAAADIWSFEHLVDKSTAHYAVRSPVLQCTHVVERGKWLPAAASLFSAAGLPFDPGQRARWPRSAQWRMRLGKLRFAVFGYTGVRARRFVAFLGGRKAPAIGAQKDPDKCSTAG